MNKIFKVVWSKTKECYVVVSEVAKNNGGKKKVLASVLAGLAMVSIGQVQAAQTQYGSGSTATGAEATAVGVSSTATKSYATAVGYLNKAEGIASIAAGSNNKVIADAAGVQSDYSYAVGSNNTITGSTYASAFGRENNVVGEGSTALGYNNLVGIDRASGNAIVDAATGAKGAGRATAIGYQSEARGNRNVAIGNQAIAQRDDSVAIGSEVQALSGHNIAIGSKSVAQASTDQASVGIAIGLNVKAVGQSTTDKDLIAIGNSSNATANGAVAIGSLANATGRNSYAMGNNATASASGAVAIGQVAGATGHGATAFGNGAQSYGIGSTGIGRLSYASENGATAIGANSAATGYNSIAIGADEVTGTGNLDYVNNNFKTPGATADTIGSTRASGKYAVALSTEARASKDDAVAIGHKATASIAGGVALGSESKTTKAAGEIGYNPATGRTNDYNKLTNNTKAALTSTRAAISIGDDSASVTRQLTGLAAGTQDTDAVNVAQLKAVNLKFAGDSTQVTGSTDVRLNDGTFNVNGDGTLISTEATATGIKVKAKVGGTITNDPSNDGKAKAPTTDGIATTTNVTDAINNSGWKVTSSNNGGTTNGTSVEKVSPGDKVTFSAGKNIVLDQNGKQFTYSLSDTVALTNTGSLTVGNTKVNNGGVTITAPTGGSTTNVTLTQSGLDNGGNKIVNVKDGDVSATSKEAVNGSQLHAVAAKERHIAPTTASHAAYTVDNNGDVTLDYVDGDGAATSEKAIIKGVAKQDLSNITNAGKQVITGLSNKVVAGDNITVDETEDTTTKQKTYKVNAKLAKLEDGTNTTVTGDGTTGNAYHVNVAGDLTGISSITNGGTNNGKISFGPNKTVTVDGDHSITLNASTGTIGGLQNKTFDPTNITSGQAATEDQLKSVHDTLKASELHIAPTESNRTGEHIAGGATSNTAAGAAANAYKYDATTKQVVLEYNDGTGANKTGTKAVIDFSALNTGAGASSWNIASDKVSTTEGTVAAGSAATQNIADGKTVTMKAGKNLTVKQENMGGNASVAFSLDKDLTNLDKVVVNGENGTNGKDGVTIIGPQGATGATGMPGTNGIDGKVGITGKDGKDAVSIAGKDGVGTIGLTGPQGPAGTNGKSVDISTENGTQTLVKPEANNNNQSQRIVYVPKDANGNPLKDDAGNTIKREVATMDDGLKFTGNNESTVNKHNLGSLVKVQGEGTKEGTNAAGTKEIQTSDGTKFESAKDNIAVEANNGDTLTVKLNKNLKGLDSVQTKTVELGDHTTPGSTTNITYNPTDKRIEYTTPGTTQTKKVATTDDIWTIQGDGTDVAPVGGKVNVKAGENILITTPTTADGSMTINAVTPAVYTDKNGNKLTKDKDGKFHKPDGTEVQPADVITSIQDAAGNVTGGNSIVNNVGSAIKNAGNAGDSFLTKLDAANTTTPNAAVNVSDLKNTADGLTNKGLRFDANEGNEKTNKLGSKVTVQGTGALSTGKAYADEYNTANIRTKIEQGADGNTTINVGLAKALKDINSISNGGSSITISDVPAGATTPAVTISGGNLSMGNGTTNNKIVNLAPGTDGTDAVNVKQLKDTELHITPGTYTPGADKKVKLTYTDGNNAVVTGKEAVIDLSGLSTGGTTASSWNVKSSANTTDGGAVADNHNANAQNIADGKSVEFQSGKNLVVKQTNDTANGNATVEFSLSDNITAGKNGANGKDGSVGVTGKDGSSVVINGADGSIGMTGPKGQDGKDGINGRDGANLSMTSAKGEQVLVNRDPAHNADTDKAERIVYVPKDASGNPIQDANGKNIVREVATMDDGLKFTGNNESIENKHKLGSLVKVQGEGVTENTTTNKLEANGEEFKSASGNIAVVADSIDKLTVKLNKNLKGLDSVQTKTVELGDHTTPGGTTNITYNSGDKRIEYTTPGATAGTTETKKVATTDDIWTIQGNGTDVAPVNGKVNVKAGENILITTPTTADGSMTINAVTPAVYTDKDGNKLTKDKDGKFHKDDGTEVAAADVITSIQDAAGHTTGGNSIVNNVGSAINNHATPGVTSPTYLDKLDAAAGDTKTQNAAVNVTDLKNTADGLTDKGLKFDANVGGVKTNKLGSTVKVQGAGTSADADYSGANIKTFISQTGDDTTIDVKLDKNLKGINKISNGGSSITLNDTPSATVPAVTITGGNLSMGDGTTNNKIVNLAPGTADTDAVNVKQLKDTELHITPGTYTPDTNKKVTLTYTNGNGTVVSGKEAVIDLSGLSTGGATASTWNVKSSANTTDGGAVGATHDATAQNIANGKTVEFQSGKNLVVNQTNDTTNGNATVEFSLSDNITVGKDGANGKDGSVGAKGADGSAVVMNGKDGSIGLNGTNGANGISIKGKDGANGVGIDGKDGVTRIVYTEKVPDPANPGTTKEVTHEVATMDDGLKFTGNNTATENKQKLGSLVKVQGEGVTAADEAAFQSASGNIAVTADGTDTLTIRLNKNLKGLNSIQLGGNTIQSNGDNITFTTNGGTTKTVATTDQLWTIQANGTDVPAKSGKVNLVAGDHITITPDAANGKMTISATGFGSMDGFNVKTSAESATVGTHAGDTTENIKNGKTVDMQAGKNLIVTQTNDGNGNTTVNYALNKDVDLGTNGSLKAGDTTVNKDGVTIANGPSITKTGVDAGDKKITNVADGAVNATSKDAVNGSQLKKYTDAAKTTVEAGDTNVKVETDNSAADGHTNYKVSLEPVVTIGDTHKVKIDGHTGDITGLTNVNLTDPTFATKGRAATEEQLKQVLTEAKNKAIEKVQAGTAAAGDTNIATVAPKAGDTFGTAGATYEVSVSKNAVKDAAKEAVKVTSASPAITVTADTSVAHETTYKVGFDGNQAATQIPLTYKQNGGSARTVKLSDGLNFIDGTNTKARTAADGKVTFDVMGDLTGITSISNAAGGPKMTFGGNSINVTNGDLNMGGNKITNLGKGTATTDAATVGQLTKVTSNNHSVVINKTTDANGAPVYDLAVSGTPGAPAADPRVDMLGEEIGRVGAQGAALSALKPIQYDPLEPTQIMAGYGNYRGNSAVALGVAHYKNESTLIHGGVSWAGGSSHMMANAGVTWKVGNRDSEAAVADRYRKGPISSAYAMQQEMAAMKAQNAGLKGEVSDLKAENEQMKAQIAAMMAKLGL